jgi:putative membrane protein
MLKYAFIPVLLTMSGGTLLAQAAAPDLTDPQVAHVAVTANTIDIEMGKLAQRKATNPEVKQFAATMITDHTAVNEQASALATRLKVTPQDNPVSQSLQKGATDARATIEPKSGAAFDRAYIDREVAYHQAVLDALDKLLIPTTENADLKKLLTDVRPAIAAHLAHAKQIQSSLGATQ